MLRIRLQLKLLIRILRIRIQLKLLIRGIANSATTKIANSGIANSATTEIANSVIANSATTEIANSDIANSATTEIANSDIANSATTEIANPGRAMGLVRGCWCSNGSVCLIVGVVRLGVETVGCRSKVSSKKVKATIPFMRRGISKKSRVLHVVQVYEMDKVRVT
ncbi:hypothetical protein Tco_0262028 [Tanacetum coccineum]